MKILTFQIYINYNTYNNYTNITIMDVCISFDTTGSMSQVIAETRKNIIDLTQKLFAEIKDLKISIIAHGDYCDDGETYLTKHIDFTNDPVQLVDFVKNTGDTCGGDYPEAYEYVLNKVQSFSWSSDNRSLIMIGDAYPHEKNANPYNLDWRNEAQELAKMGVNIYSVQALNSGSSKSYTFYKQISQVTNGYHLYLNQFSHIIFMITAIFYKQQKDKPESLQQYEEHIEQTTGMNKNLRDIFDVMLGRKTESEFDYHKFANPKAKPLTYKKTKTDGTTIEEADATEIVPALPAKYQLLNVPADSSIKDFVTSNKLTFKAGKGFYEFTKPETITTKKKVVLMKKDTGELYEGKGARKIIGLTGLSKKYKPHDIPEYKVFIQSTSYNRKLIGNTTFLYEATDFGHE